MDHFELFIDGAFCKGSGSFPSLNPATNTPWAMIAEAREAEVNAAVAAAERAFRTGDWPAMTATQRGKLLFRLADLLEEAAPALALIETRDTGKLLRETSSQIAYVAQYYRYFAGLADKIEGAHLPIDKPDMEVWLRREPIGVVAAIVPWNSQLMLAAVKLAPALAAGCTVVLKASEDGPAPLLKFAEIVQEAGFPKGVVNIITGFADSCGAVLSSHPDIAHIAFTGGPNAARHVMRGAAESLASTSLELGGKSPFILFEDADLDSALNAQIAGVFAATGQSCVAGSRLLIQESLKEGFLQRLVSRAGQIAIGAPEAAATEIGPLCTGRQLAHIQDLVDRSLAAGAKLLCGGKALEGEGNFYPPTILDCSEAPDAPCLQEEFFGPVLSVLPFRDEAHALELANNTRYGLASGVFTRDLTRAHRMSKGIRAGVVWINTYRAVSPMAPFGGFGLSGRGREAGAASIHDYTTTKTVWLRTSDSAIQDPFVMR